MHLISMVYPFSHTLSSSLHPSPYLPVPLAILTAMANRHSCPLRSWAHLRPSLPLSSPSPLSSLSPSPLPPSPSLLYKYPIITLVPVGPSRADTSLQYSYLVSLWSSFSFSLYPFLLCCFFFPNNLKEGGREREREGEGEKITNNRIRNTSRRQLPSTDGRSVCSSCR